MNDAPHSSSPNGTDPSTSYTTIDNEAWGRVLLMVGADVKVYGYLARTCFGKKRSCWPAKDTIAEAVRLDVKSVQRSLRRLEAAGEIFSEQRPGKVTKYTLTPERRGDLSDQGMRPRGDLSDQGCGHSGPPKKAKEEESGVEAIKGSTPDEHWEDSAPALNGGAGPPSQSSAGMAIEQLMASSASRARRYGKTADERLVDHQRKQEVIREKYGFTKADEIEVHRKVVRPGDDGDSQTPPGDRDGGESTRGQPAMALPAERGPSTAEGV